MFSVFVWVFAIIRVVSRWAMGELRFDFRVSMGWRDDSTRKPDQDEDEDDVARTPV